MKKCKIFVAVAMAAVVLFGGVAFKISASANEQVESENWKETRELNVDQFNKLVPVITALSGHVHTRNSGYDAYRSTFYETSFNGILKYSEQDKLADYTEDDNYYYLDWRNMCALSDIAYYGGSFKTLQEIDNEEVAYYDEESGMYIIRKKDIDMGYSVKLTKAEETNGKYDYEYYTHYYLEGELYKDGNKVDNIRVYVEPCENSDVNFPYSIKNVLLDKHGIEVY